MKVQLKTGAIISLDILDNVKSQLVPFYKTYGIKPIYELIHKAIYNKYEILEEYKDSLIKAKFITSDGELAPFVGDIIIATSRTFSINPGVFMLNKSKAINIEE